MNEGNIKLEGKINKLFWNLSIIESLNKVLLENALETRKLTNSDETNILTILDEKIKDSKSKLEEITEILDI